MDSTSIFGYPPKNDPRPLRLLPGLAQCDVQVHLLLAAIDGDAHGVASPMVVHYLSQILWSEIFSLLIATIRSPPSMIGIFARYARSLPARRPARSAALPG